MRKDEEQRCTRETGMKWRTKKLGFERFNIWV